MFCHLYLTTCTQLEQLELNYKNKYMYIVPYLVGLRAFKLFLRVMAGSCASEGSHTQGHVTTVFGHICYVCTHLLTSHDLVTMARTVTRGAVAGWIIIVMACIVPQTG